MKKIILATTSPYRIDAFKMLGLSFEAVGSDVDEYFENRPTDPEELVAHLAKLKAESVAAKCNHESNAAIIGFDSVGWFKGKILEKPTSKEELTNRLMEMSGHSYLFFTGIHIISGEKIKKDVVETEVVLRTLTRSEITYYLEQDPRYKTFAQGFDPLETYGSTFIKELYGSYNNVLRGIPLEVIIEMLREI